MQFAHFAFESLPLSLRIGSFFSSALAPNRIEMHFLSTDNFYAGLSLSLLLLLSSIIDDALKNTRNRTYARSELRDI
jgi:hypothetical protein